MRAPLRRIKQSNADAIYFAAYPEAAVVLGRSYSNVGLNIPVFATSAFEDPQVPEKTSGVLSGTVYTKPAGDTPKTKSFRDAYQKAHEQEPGLTADTAYDAMSLILDAILAIRDRGGEVTGKAIHDYLLQVKDYEGASGRLSFDQQGDVRVPIDLFVLRNGQYQKLQPKKAQLNQ
jgi:branched-chain amino acid transport system substrate-binding protein